MTIVGDFENGFTGWTIYDEPGSNSQVLITNNTLIVDGQPGPGALVMYYVIAQN